MVTIQTSSPHISLEVKQHLSLSLSPLDKMNISSSQSLTLANLVVGLFFALVGVSAERKSNKQLMEFAVYARA